MINLHEVTLMIVKYLLGNIVANAWNRLLHRCINPQHVDHEVSCARAFIVY